MDSKELEKKIERYEKLADKNYDIYQQTGESRYLSTYEKYNELADVYRMAFKYKLDHDEAQSRRLSNMSYFIKEHIEKRFKNEYTKNEVIDLANQMKQFAL